MGINCILGLHIPMQVYFKCILLNFAMFAGYKFERKNFKLFIGGSTASNACGMQGYINENKLYIPIAAHYVTF